MRPLPATLIRLAWANLAARAADQLALAAIPMLAVLHLGAGAGDTGLLAAAQTLPFLLLSIPAGLLADRGSRRRLMTGAELVRLGALAAIPALAATGGLSIAAPCRGGVIRPALPPPRGRRPSPRRASCARAVPSGSARWRAGSADGTGSRAAG